MFSKSNTRYTIMIILLLVLVASIFYWNSTKEVYGNDINSIIQVIKSIEGYEHKEIEILGMQDFKEIRVVGFLANQSPGFIQFVKNKDGNYKWDHAELKYDVEFQPFILIPDLPKIMFVTTHENKIAKIHVTVNGGKKLEQEFTPYHATVDWMDIPSHNKNYSFEYTYYDQDGNVIETNHH